MFTLAELRARRDALLAELRAIVDLAATETRELTADEATRFDAADAERRTLEETTIPAAEAQERAASDLAAADERRRDAIAAIRRSAGPVARVGAEPQIYGRGSAESYFLDLARWERQGNPEAHRRLTRHAQELEVELPRREAARAARADREARSVFGSEASPFEKRVNPNRVDGQGGYFVPPLWLVDEYVPLLRNGRPFANVVRQMDLPGGTDSINIPKVNTGTAVGVQAADGGAVSSVDLTDTFVTAPVRTLAGQQDIAMQLLDQSPIAFDEVVMADLAADYARLVDSECLNGTNTAGRLQGIDGMAGTNAVTYTDGTPTGPELFVPLAQAISQLASNRKVAPTHYVMHARRWFWLCSQLDSQNRPLVTPYPGNAFNPLAIDSNNEPQGIVGNILGVPVLLDMNITTTAGGGTEDRIYAINAPDLFLFEGTPRMRTLQEVLSGTIQVRIQLYNYLAFLPNRYPTAVSTISGTGLAAPAGF